MHWTQVLGAVILASPILGLFAAIVVRDGWGTAFALFGATVVVVGGVLFGAALLTGTFV